MKNVSENEYRLKTGKGFDTGGRIERAFKHGKNPFPGYRVVSYDFEFISVDGERPEPVCLVWHDWST